MRTAASPRRLVRKRKGAVFAGVCAGVAEYFGWDVAVVRLLWVFLLAPGGLPGFVPYLLLWLIMPLED